MLGMCSVILCWHLLVHTGSSPRCTFIFNFRSEISVGNLTLQIQAPKLSILIAYHWKTKMMGECEPHRRLLCCCKALVQLKCTTPHQAQNSFQCEAREAERPSLEECLGHFSFTSLSLPIPVCHRSRNLADLLPPKPHMLQGFSHDVWLCVRCFPEGLGRMPQSNLICALKLKTWLDLGSFIYS